MLEEDLGLAHELVSLASEIALAHFQRGVSARPKADGSPVTDADLEVERCLVERLQRDRPGDEILGEELGSLGDSKRRWILDPIDMTFSFAAGNLQWGTHVALEHEGEIVLGVISRPALSKSWWATRGGGAHRSDWSSASPNARIRVSTTSELGESRVGVWAEEPHEAIARLKTAGVWVQADLNAILDVAEGRLDGVVDPSGKPWDHAPAVLIVEEAGGRFSDREGGSRIDLGEGRYTNGRIHEALARALGD